MTSCRSCSRPLRDPVSVERGVGPVCDPEPRHTPRPLRAVKVQAGGGEQPGLFDVAPVRDEAHEQCRCGAKAAAACDVCM